MSKPFEVSLHRAESVLRSGGLVALPTETVYGLAALVSNPKACARIFEVKQRPYFDPLILHARDLAMLTPYIAPTPRQREWLETLAQTFWPGPLTLILPKTSRVPDIVTAGLDTVAVRVPRHPFAQALLEQLNEPFVAPSANPFGKLSPTRAQHVRDHLPLGPNDALIDLEGCEAGLESTIVDLTQSPARLRRPGAIALEELTPLLGELETHAPSSDAGLFPGETLGHYAPAHPLILLSRSDLEALPTLKRQNAAALFWGPMLEGFAAHERLSPTQDLPEAASRLFECLHRLHALPITRIYAEALPEHGLGRAIMNRLRKAQASFPQT